MLRCSKTALPGAASPNCIMSCAASRRIAHRLMTSPDEETSIVNKYSTSALAPTPVVALGWVLAWRSTLALILRPLAYQHQLWEV
jgi:hypothetical protein